MIPLDDRGFTLGDGLFETVLHEDGRLDHWPEHFARLVRGCQTLGLPAPSESEALAAVHTALQAMAGVRAAVRLTYSAGSGGRGLDRPSTITPRLVATAAASPLFTEPARLMTASVRRNEASPAARLKTLSYLDNVLARREAIAAGAEEAVMLNTRGELACAAAANLFWIKDSVLFTPALACGALDGVMRGRLLRQAREVRAGPDALETADAIYLTNSLIGVRPVRRLGGRDLTPGPALKPD